jgi:hypothetical protein
MPPSPNFVAFNSKWQLANCNWLSVLTLAASLGIFSGVKQRPMLSESFGRFRQFWQLRRLWQSWQCRHAAQRKPAVGSISWTKPSWHSSRSRPSRSRVVMHNPVCWRRCTISCGVMGKGRPQEDLASFSKFKHDSRSEGKRTERGLNGWEGRGVSAIVHYFRSGVLLKSITKLP